VKAAEQWFREPAVARLKKEGLASEWYYTTSADVDDKKVSMGGTLPDTGRNVNGLTNAISLLVETRGVGLGRLHLKRRVYTHVTAIASILQSAASRAPDLVKLRQFVDQDVSSKACQGELVVEAAPTPSEYRLLMLDPATGADKPVVVTWDSALQLTPVKVRPRPCGYWLAEQEADAVRHLRALGVRVARLEEGGEVRGEAYRETAREVVRRSDPEGSGAGSGAGAADALQVKVQLLPALLDLRAGGYYVPLDQPLGNLVAAALEPDTEISFFANRIVSAMAGEGRVLLQPEMRMAPVP
ncbi:MAG: peptidase M14, partial [Pseudomonadota bacterium]|nr:peptidase M14 [Pseudomonadota bacterium]